MRKGQTTIVGMILLVVTLIAYVMLYPTLNTIITDNVGSMDANTALIVQFIPIFIPIMILVAGLWYIFPHRQIVSGGN